MSRDVYKRQMLGSGTEACMVAARIARLKTKKKNILKMGGAYHGWSDQLAYGIRVPGTKGLMSKGVPNFVFKHTNEFFPGDLDDLERKLKMNELTGGTAAIYICLLYTSTHYLSVSRNVLFFDCLIIIAHSFTEIKNFFQKYKTGCVLLYLRLFSRKSPG